MDEPWLVRKKMMFGLFNFVARVTVDASSFIAIGRKSGDGYLWFVNAAPLLGI